jgi:high-affinity Fe2+/Pb2+ permease
MSDASKKESDPGQRISARTVTTTWAALVAATIMGWMFARGSSGGSAQAGVVILAAVKIYLVIAIFMGLARAPRGWHLAAIAWTATTCGIVYLLASGAPA